MNLRTQCFTALICMLAIPAAIAAELPQQQPAENARRTSSTFPDDVAGLEAMAAQAIADGNGLRLLQSSILLRKQRPYEPAYLVNMVRAYAMIERPRSAFNYMLEMQKQGLFHDFNQYEETTALRDTEVYQYLNDLLIRAATPAGEAETAFRLDANWALPVALAWDEGRQRFLVGTAADGVLLAVDDSGETSELLRANEENGLRSITDIEVDAARNRLWVASAAIPVFSGFRREDAGQSALHEFQLDTLEQVARYVVPADGLPHELGPIAVAPNGDVFVADRLVTLVYRKKADSDQIEPYLADPEMVAFRDMTISDDGRRLYVADVAKGVLVVDPKAESAIMLQVPENLNLGGIEGLFRTDDALIIIQSGIRPQRVMSLQLDTQGGKVESVRPMAIALEAFDGPSFGTIRGDAVYYFADVHLPQAGEAPRPVTVLETPLDAGHDIVPPDMMKFEEETLSKRRDKD